MQEDKHTNISLESLQAVSHAPLQTPDTFDVPVFRSATRAVRLHLHVIIDLFLGEAACMHWTLVFTCLVFYR